MTLTRRHFLTGTGALALGTLLSPSARAEQSQPLVYSLEDVLSPEKDLPQLRTLNLQTIPKPALVYIWSTHCQPCWYEMPRYNQLYRRYGKKVYFLSLLAENIIIQQRGDQKVRSRSCVLDFILEESSYEERNQFHEEYAKGPPYPPFLQTIITKCSRIAEETQRTIVTPAERLQLKAAIQQLQRKGIWPAFPTYVLDDSTAADFLLYEGVIPRTVFIHQGTRKVVERKRGVLEKILRRL